jgi:5-methylcytosine-specific restriction protein A
MIRELLLKIFDEYPLAKQENFTEHPLADYIRQEVPRVFRSTFDQLTEMLFVASPGKGRWADAPWIAVFDPAVTETAQEGYYPVYLFNRSMTSVYLSLNQGMALLTREVGFPQAKRLLEVRAELLRTRIGTKPARFSADPIDLEPQGSTDRLAMYEPGHAIGKVYQANSLPSENDLVLDLLDMVEFYRRVKFLGGIDDVNAVVQISEEPGEYSVGLTLEEKRRLTLHRRIERNHRLALLAKRIHGYSCQVCGFDFSQHYGDLGKDYIEAHHLVPLASLDADKPAFLSPERDFAVVCANCHKMIHRPGAPKSWEEFIKLYREENTK